MTFEINGDSHALLGGVTVKPTAQEKEKRVLDKWWGIGDRAQLLQTLNWLRVSGHRAEFDELGRRVDTMNEAEFAAAKAQIVMDPEGLSKLDILRKYHRSLGEKSILAWDLSRYTMLCRWGYLVGYLSEAEAWDRIMPAAVRLQRTFDSWKDLESNFLIGREYWSWAQTQENGQRFREIYQRFTTEPGSPWKVNPWNTNLGPSTEALALGAN